MINILIVHYNTPTLTSALVKSINHFTPNSNIYIFDNSDTKPFVNEGFENVMLIDNTQGQYIDFDAWLENYPNRFKSRGALNNFGSAKHCYSVQKCMDLFDENFILLDSDVLLKRDISDLWNDDYIYIGQSEIHQRLGTKRVLPFICFINNKLCKEKGIKYYNEKMMHGLWYSQSSERYDTGGAFYEATKAEFYKPIKWHDYVVHYQAGSWKNANNIGRGLTADQWLGQHRNLWYFENTKKTDKLVVSLTSYKERLKFIPQVLQSLWRGKIKPFKTVLTLDEKDVRHIASESRELKRLIDRGEIVLLVSKEAIKPHTKYFFAMKEYRDCAIVTVDDDIIYPADTLESLYFAYLKQPKCVISRRVHRIKRDKEGHVLPYNKWELECTNTTGPSFDLFATGVGGILYPPNILEIDDTLLPEIRQCLNADDVFLKYLEAKKRIPVYYIKPEKNSKMKQIESSQKRALSSTNTKNVKGVPNNDDYLKKFPPYSPNYKVVYTCITGDYDTIKQPTYLNHDFDFICFTDNEEWLQRGHEGVWQIRPIPQEWKSLSKVKQQRMMKILPHRYLKKYDVSIWIDGSITVKGDILKLLDKYNPLVHDMWIPKHPTRKNIIEEGKAIVDLKKDTQENIDHMLSELVKKGYDLNIQTLPQSGIIIRNHNDEKVKQAMELWAQTLREYSYRDQLSFSYAIDKTEGVNWGFMDKRIFNSDYFFWNSKHIPHRKKKTTERQPINFKTLDKKIINTFMNGYF